MLLRPLQEDFVCEYIGEYNTYATAVARCAARGKEPCLSHRRTAAPDECKLRNRFTWLSDPCGPMGLQVAKDGAVSLVDTSSPMPEYALDSGNTFRVRWAGGAYPTVAAGLCASHARPPSLGVSRCSCGLHCAHVRCGSLSAFV